MSFDLLSEDDLLVVALLLPIPDVLRLCSTGRVVHATLMRSRQLWRTAAVALLGEPLVGLHRTPRLDRTAHAPSWREAFGARARPTSHRARACVQACNSTHTRAASSPCTGVAWEAKDCARFYRRLLRAGRSGEHGLAYANTLRRQVVAALPKASPLETLTLSLSRTLGLRLSLSLSLSGDAAQDAYPHDRSLGHGLPRRSNPKPSPSP